MKTINSDMKIKTIVKIMMRREIKVKINSKSKNYN